MVKPLRAWCPVHETAPQSWCSHCLAADDLTTWWRHAQGRCVPASCPHCARMTVYG